MLSLYQQILCQIDILCRNMKKILLFAIVLIASATGLNAQERETYFPYPIVPDSITTLQGRTDYLISHFWDFCDFKKAFNNKKRMGETFKEYLAFMPFASAKQAFKSISILLKDIEKQPDYVLFLGEKAKEYVHSDTSEIYSDELYLPFARAVVENKKISEAAKEKFRKDVKVLTYTQTGMSAPSFTYIDRAGIKQEFQPDTTQVTIIFFTSPDCVDCTLARSRLYADIKASQFVESGVMRIVAINPEADSEEWRKAAERYPQEWTVGVAPGLDEMYDIKFVPSFYIIDENNVIHLKNANIDTMLNVIMRL